MEKERLDKLLVKIGFMKTRSQAQQFIKDGNVEVDGKVIKKSGAFATLDSSIKLLKEVEFVGRGAYKIEKAYNEFNLDFEGKVIADVGASTGGFTDFSLQRGARLVHAIDVGHGQLAKELISDNRVQNLEGINIKHPYKLDSLADFCVVDLSFISLKLVLKNIFDLGSSNVQVIVLIKPQFEVGREGLDKNGIVKKREHRVQCVESLYEWGKTEGLHFNQLCNSAMSGKTGNIEYLALMSREENDFELSSKLKKSLL